jgi:release factor glutamine methyltransferase
MWTVSEILKWTTARFKERDIPSARLDAELLLADAIGGTRVSVYTSFERPLAESEREKMREYVRRRSEGEPISYILGNREFFGREFLVNDNVLIPRPDTECLIELMLNEVNPKQNNPAILDLGTGSGCISITLALEYVQSEVLAVDVCEKALDVAIKNSRNLGVENRVKFLCADVTDDRFWRADGNRFDVIVSNPPYISKAEFSELETSVRSYEPEIALLGDHEGLVFYEIFAKNCHNILNENGKLFLEIGANQSDAVTNLFDLAGWSNIKLVRDYAGLPRVLVVMK